MQEIRCKKCKRLLAKEKISNGLLEIVCPRCGNRNKFERVGSDVK